MSHGFCNVNCVLDRGELRKVFLNHLQTRQTKYNIIHRRKHQCAASLWVIVHLPYTSNSWLLIKPGHPSNREKLVGASQSTIALVVDQQAEVSACNSPINQTNASLLLYGTLVVLGHDCFARWIQKVAVDMCNDVAIFKTCEVTKQDRCNLSNHNHDFMLPNLGVILRASNCARMHFKRCISWWFVRSGDNSPVLSFDIPRIFAV